MDRTASGVTGAVAGLSVPTAPAINKGRVFPSRDAARIAAGAELASTGRSIKNGRSAGRVTFHVVCKTCTSWFVKAQRQANGDFKVTQVGNDHVNCVGGGRRPSAIVVQPLIDQLVRANPKTGDPGIKRTLKTAEYEISDRTSQRSKRRITTTSRAEEAEAIARIPSWCEAVERDCPGSVATVETSTDHRFVRSFFMLGKAAYAAVRSVPKVVAMDAGHLKGSWNGVMYILSMMDSNNKIIHVSTVLADKENETNYRFLPIQTCKNDHMKTLLTSGTVTFFTDGHRGSPPALAKVVPMAPVRTCLRHLLTNKQMRRMGTDYSAAVYKAAKMPTKMLFDEAMAPIKELFPGNYAFLTSYPFKTWTHHANNSELREVNHPRRWGTGTGAQPLPSHGDDSGADRGETRDQR